MAQGRDRRAVLLALLCVLLEACSSVHGRALLAVARDEQHINMHNEGHKHLLGAPCHLEVELAGNSKYQPCQDIELISEAIEVIYAFAVGLEPAEVAVSRVGCNIDGINVAITFAGAVTNATMSDLVNNGPPRLMETTLAPFGLSLKSTTIQYNVHR